MLSLQDTSTKPITITLDDHHLTLYHTPKSLDSSKLKAFQDDKIYVCEKLNWFGKGRKHIGKRRKCWLPAFSPFPSMFSKGILIRVVKSRDCVVKS